MAIGCTPDRNFLEERNNGAVNGVARTIAWGGSLMRLIQSGQTQHYALGMTVGAVLILTMYLLM